jgi:putative transposase
MPRAQTILQSEYPYNIGARCINREWFDLPMPEVWQIMSEQLHFLTHAYSVKIHAFVLMNNHYHLLMSTPEANLSDAMEWFGRETSRQLVKQSSRLNQTYGGRFFRSILKSNLYYLHAYKYLYANPLKAGLVSRVEDYPYSTLRGLLGFERQIFPMAEDTTLFENVEGTLQWLNRPVTEKNWESVRRALRWSEFKFPKLNKKDHPLEFDAL